MINIIIEYEYTLFVIKLIIYLSTWYFVIYLIQFLFFWKCNLWKIMVGLFPPLISIENNLFTRKGVWCGQDLAPRSTSITKLVEEIASEQV